MQKIRRIKGFQASVNSRSRRIVLRTVAAAVVVTVHAPPAMVFLQALQFQIPTADLFTESFPQKVHVYLACCETSIFFTCFLSEAP